MTIVIKILLLCSKYPFSKKIPVGMFYFVPSQHWLCKRFAIPTGLGRAGMANNRCIKEITLLILKRNTIQSPIKKQPY